MPQHDVWLLVRRDLKNVPRVTALTDYLFDLFQRERRLFEVGTLLATQPRFSCHLSKLEKP